MSEFHLDTDGGVEAAPGSGLVGVIHFHDDLDAFTQGYIEALFFTSGDEPGRIDGRDVGFADLAPETLASILEDCRKFQEGEAYRSAQDAPPEDQEAFPDNAPSYVCDRHAGCDFLYTRNGHGCGFWDGDWPEPYATALTNAAKAFPAVDAYLGDDGKVYLS